MKSKEMFTDKDTTAVLVPSLRDPFFAAVADEVTERLKSKGYRAILMVTNYEITAERKCIEMLRQNRLDGLISPTCDTELMAAEDIPIVTVGFHCDPTIPAVVADSFGAGELAAKRLIELGCKRLVYMHLGTEPSGESDRRRGGFEGVCRGAGAECESVTDSVSFHPFYRYIDRHITGGEPDFDGIFCGTDNLASTIVKRLNKLGIGVPEQIQIIGCGGLIDRSGGKRVCSTIALPIHEIADAAVNVLLAGNRSEVPAITTLPVSYRAGGTTRDTL